MWVGINLLESPGHLARKPSLNGGARHDRDAVGVRGGSMGAVGRVRIMESFP